MNDRIPAYLISLGLVGTGFVWIVGAMDSMTAAIWITIGVLTIIVGATSLLLEFRNRPR